MPEATQIQGSDWHLTTRTLFLNRTRVLVT